MTRASASTCSASRPWCWVSGPGGSGRRLEAAGQLQEVGWQLPGSCREAANWGGWAERQLD